MARLPAFAAILVLALALAACAPQPEPAAAEQKASTPEGQAAQQAADWPTDVAIHRDASGAVVCPVMNTAIKAPGDAVGHQDYEGKRYYFCCGGCPQAFKAEPAKYAKK
jgi:Cu+-exporting ATPase